MKPYMSALTGDGVSVLLVAAAFMVPAATILIEGIDKEDYWNVQEQLRAWDLGFSGDEILVSGGLI